MTPKKTPAQIARKETIDRKQAAAKRQFLELYAANLGNVAATCKAMNIHRSTVHRWGKDPKFKKDMDEILEDQIDFVEYHLMRQVKEGNVTAMIFFLKTRARHRGYDERLGLDINRPIVIEKHRELADI